MVSNSLLSTDQSLTKHDNLVSDCGTDVAICYTDGSAMPNPGPSGAGVSIFLRNPDIVIDAGISTGFNTNNLAELVALAVCLSHLSSIHCLFHFKKAVIFCDSRYALAAAVSSKKSTSNQAAVNHLRNCHSTALACFSVQLCWLKGHANVGGNERVDGLSKAFAQANPSPPLPFIIGPNLPYSNSQKAWEFGYPLSNIPFKFFKLSSGCTNFSRVPLALVPSVALPPTVRKRRAVQRPGTRSSTRLRAAS
jgi:ribonuclease HI